MDRSEAQAELARAERAVRAVRRRGPKEYLPFLGWGLFSLAVIPWFDVVDPATWGPVTIGIAAVGTVATFLYMTLRSRAVRMVDRTPVLVAIGLSVATGVVAWIVPELAENTALPFTIAGFLAAVPMLSWGTWLWRHP